MSAALPLLVFSAAPPEAGPGRELLHAAGSAGRAPGVPGLPPAFEANRGQADPSVCFLARGGGGTLLLTDGEAVFLPALAGASGAAGTRERVPLRMRPAGAAPGLRARGEELLPGRVSYFRGRDPRGWITGAPAYARVRYRDVYPGVDLVYHGRLRKLEYDFVVAPGADPGRIALEIEGAGSARIAGNGDLVLQTPGGELRQEKPALYQVREGRRVPVEGRFVLGEGTDCPRNTRKSAEGVGGRAMGGPGHRNPSLPTLPRSRADLKPITVAFAVGAYDPGRPLVIDPTLSFSTFLGGGNTDAALGVAAGPDGSLYVAGRTASVDFPVSGSRRRFAGGGTDAFVARLDSSGRQLLYSAYLGGSGDDAAHAVAVDGAGGACVAGVTQSGDFPTHRAPQPAFGGAADAFLAKLRPDGSSLVYSTYLGGSEIDRADAVALHRSGRAFVTGATRSLNFPVTPGALRTDFGGGLQDAFAAAVEPPRSSTGRARLHYSTYLGGVGDENLAGGGGLAVDDAGRAVVCGTTDSPDFPIPPGAFQPRLGGGTDLFAARLSASGGALTAATFFGGSGGDVLTGAALDGQGRVHLSGVTESRDLPTTPGAPQRAYGGGLTDAFLVRLSPDLRRLPLATYLGGSADEGTLAEAARGGPRVALRADGVAWLTGRTRSADFPVVRPLQPGLAGDADVFLTRLDARGTRFTWSTFLGGVNMDAGLAAAVDGEGSVLLAGETASRDFPVSRGTPGPVQPVHGGGETDAFVGRFTDPVPEPRPGRLTVSTRRVNFGSIRLGRTAARAVTLRNTGRGVLEGFVPQAPLPFTVFAGTGAFRLRPQESLQLRLRFAPLDVGPAEATILLRSSDPKKEEVTLRLRGQAS